MQFNPGDMVYLPRNRLGLPQNDMSSFYMSRVVRAERCKISVSMPNGVESGWVATSFAKSRIKAVVITLGDFASEPYTFDPLAKNVLHHLRLLLGPDEAMGVKVRSVEELKMYWHKEQSEISHVIFVGHGDGTNVLFGVDSWVSGSDLASALRVWGAPKKHFLSLCCKSGKAGFAKTFSKAAICEDLVAPFHTVHAAIASQFYATYISSQYLGGSTSKVAYNTAACSVVDGTRFRFWDDGSHLT
jgi:hypothetical protein